MPTFAGGRSTILSIGPRGDVPDRQYPPIPANTRHPAFISLAKAGPS